MSRSFRASALLVCGLVACGLVLPTMLDAQPTGFTVTTAQGPLTVAAGQYMRLQVQVKDVGGFDGPVTLGCSGLPILTTCVFETGTIAAGGGSTIMYVVPQGPQSCSTPAYQYYGNSRMPWWPFGAPLLVGTGWFVLPRRRSRMKAGLLVLLISGMSLLAGCGTCTNLGVQPGTYLFTVTAASGDATVWATQSAVVTMTVELP